MSIRTLKKLRRISGKRVLVRVDFNVPLKDGALADNSRLRASLPTIQYLIQKKAKIILVSHLGRPEGKVVPDLRLAPVSEALARLLNHPVKQLADWQGEEVKKEIEQMNDGEIVMLENIRFSPDEQRNDSPLAHALASLADLFVLDGFAVAHRPDASVSQVAGYIPTVAGFLLEKEIIGLGKLLQKPKKPFVAVIGGAKMETKIPVIEALLPKVDSILLGGGIVNTVLKGLGYGVGSSLFDPEQTNVAAVYAKKEKIILPIDVVVGKKDGTGSRVVSIGKTPSTICENDEAILDIGPASTELFSSIIKKAKTVVWNGAMGYFEQKPYEKSTYAIANAIANQGKKAFVVAGGGETVEAIEAIGRAKDFDLVSTGGGAMLEFLSGKKLSGVEAVLEK